MLRQGVCLPVGWMCVDAGIRRGEGEMWFFDNNCLMCSFCSKCHRDQDVEHAVTLTQKQRESARSNNFAFLNSEAYLSCHMKQLPEVLQSTDIEKLRKSLITRKCHNFFDFKKSAGMFFEAIQNNILYQKNRNEHRRLFITTFFAFVSAVAAACSAYFAYTNMKHRCDDTAQSARSTGATNAGASIRGPFR